MTIWMTEISIYFLLRSNFIISLWRDSYLSRSKQSHSIGIHCEYIVSIALKSSDSKIVDCNRCILNTWFLFLAPMITAPLESLHSVHATAISLKVTSYLFAILCSSFKSLWNSSQSPQSLIIRRYFRMDRFSRGSIGSLTHKYRSEISPPIKVPYA